MCLLHSMCVSLIYPSTSLPPSLPPPLQYYISEHGQVAGEMAMMAEIFARGPIACTIAVTPAFESYSSGIFKDTTGAVVSRGGGLECVEVGGGRLLSN